MHWILQDGFFSETGWSALIQTLERFSIDYSIHEVIPTVGELIPQPALDHKNVICIGSYSMRHAAAKQGWVPGVFDLLTQDFQQQHLHWGRYLLNFDAIVCALEDAKFTEAQMFVRPTIDSKAFSGRVFTSEEFAVWQRTVCDGSASRGARLTPKTEILLSQPVLIYAEYRFWIVKGEITARSLYKRGNQVIYTSEVDERLSGFVAERIQEWSPHETFVIDVCDTADGIKIVEINTLNSSGFYAANVQRLVLALEDAYTE